MTFDRGGLSADYLYINRLIRDLNYRRYSYDKGTELRNNIECAIEALENVKKELGRLIDEKGGKI